MAADSAPLAVTLTANTTAFEKEIAKAMRAMQRELDATAKRAANTNIMPNFQRGAQQATAGLKQTTQAAGQLQFQLNDIFTSLQGGASPLTVMSQQGSQVSAVFQQLASQGGGIKAAFSALAGAVGSMLNPISLVVNGLILAGGVAAQYFLATKKGGEDAEKTLQKQRDLIKQVADKWGEAYPALKNYNDELVRQEEAAKLLEGLAASQDKLKGEQEASLAAIDKQLAQVFALFDDFPKYGDDIGNLRTRWAELVTQMKAGTASQEDLRKFGADVVKLFNELPVGKARDFASVFQSTLLPALVSILGNLKNITSELEKAKSVAQSMPKLDPLGTLAPGASTTAPDIPGLYGQSDIEVLASRAATETVRSRVAAFDKEFAAGLAKVLRALPTARIESGVRTYDEQKRIYDSGVRPAAKPGQSRHEPSQGAAAADISGVSAAELQRVVDTIAGLETGRSFDDPFHLQLAGKGAEAVAESVTKAATALDDWMEKNQQAIELKRQEADINAQVWDTEARRAAEVEKARLVQEGMNAAIAQYGTVSPDMQAKIIATAEAMAYLGLKSAEAKEKLDQQKDSLTKLVESVDKQFTGAVQGAMSTFIKDLVAGKDASDALSEALGRVADAALDMAIQLAFQSAFGTAGGGGILSAFGIAHKGGVVGKTAFPTRAVDPGIFAGAQRMHSGGVVGLRSGEVPIIAKRGEIIMPVGSKAGGTMGGNTYSTGDINIDMSKSGTVASDTQAGRDIGLLIRKSVQSIIVQESRPGGLLRQAPIRS
jgi:hypothetical protein